MFVFRSKFWIKIFVLLFSFQQLVYSATSLEQTSYDYFLSGSKKYIKLDNNGALEDLEKAVNLNPNLRSALGLFIIVLAEEAIMSYQSQDYEKALPYLNKLLRYVPDDKEIRSIYNEAKRRVEESAGSEKEIVSTEQRLRQEFLEVWRNYLRIKAQGYSLRDRLGFLDKIMVKHSGTNLDLTIVKQEIESIKKELVLTEKDKDFNIRFNIGLRKYKTGDFQEALSVWVALKKDYPDYKNLDDYISQTKRELESRLTYLNGKASVDFQKGNWGDASRNWELVLALDSDNEIAKRSLSELRSILKDDFDAALNYYKQGLYHKAIAKWQNIAKRYPNYPGVNASIGKANRELSTMKRSEKLTAVGQYFKEAQDLFLRREYVECVNLWKKILEIDPQNKNAQAKIDEFINKLKSEGDSLYSAHNFNESQKKWGLILKINPKDEKAREMLNLCMKGFEENENKYYKLGEEAFNSGNYLNALENFKKVLLIAPQNSKVKELVIESYLAQGIVYYRTEQLSKAVEQWDQALKLNPNNEKARNYKTRALIKLESIRKLKDGKR
ncbi:MAG: tetratricopeptide repeat protein [bacterium]